MKKIVAKALVRNLDGKLLLLYRGKTHPHFPGHLDLPGGEVEEGEQIKDAIIREIQEETGIVITSSQTSKAFEINYPNVNHVLFNANVSENDLAVRLSWEHQGYEWLSVEEIIIRGIDSSMDPYYVDVFSYLVKKSS